MFAALFLVCSEAIRHVYIAALAKYRPSLLAHGAQDKYQDQYETVFIGDSQFAMGIDLSILSNSARYARAGTSYASNYFTLNWILRAKPKNLNAVVITLDRHSFAEQRLGGPVDLDKAAIVNVLRADVRDELSGRYTRKWIRDRLFPYADLPRTFANRSPEQSLLRLERSFSSNVPNPKFRSLWAFRVASGLIKDRPWYDERMAWYLETMIAQAQAQQIGVVLVQCPISREFDTEMRKCVPDDAYEAFKASLLQRHPAVAMLDYRGRFFDRPDLFVDPDHLNADGARKFSRMLQEDLEALGFATR